MRPNFGSVQAALLASSLAAFCAACSPGEPSASTGEASTTLDARESRDWGYRVWFPGATKTSTVQMSSVAGPLEQHVEMFEDAHGALGVNWADYPAAVVEKLGASSILESAVRGAAQSVRSRIELNRATRFDGFPAREMLAVDEQGAAFRGRMILAGRRLFQVIVTTTRERLEETRARRFFDSFRLAPR